VLNLSRNAIIHLNILLVRNTHLLYSEGEKAPNNRVSTNTTTKRNAFRGWHVVFCNACQGACGRLTICLSDNRIIAIISGQAFKPFCFGRGEDLSYCCCKTPEKSFRQVSTNINSTASMWSNYVVILIKCKHRWKRICIEWNCRSVQKIPCISVLPDYDGKRLFRVTVVRRDAIVKVFDAFKRRDCCNRTSQDIESF
jgi:hypothetical protein